jgi:uncharacterized phiE125 gp8 family phage protein
MLTSLRVTEEPAGEPATIDLVREHCRIDHPADDALLAGYLTAARIMAEGYLSRALLTQTLLWTMRPDPRSPGDYSRLRGEMQLPRAPVQSIVSVTLTDRLGNHNVIAPATLPVPVNTSISGYISNLDFDPGRLMIGWDTPLVNGSVNWADVGDIQISMVAGYGEASDVPQTIVQAILLTTAYLYENRGDVEASMPRAAEWLLDRHRLQFLGGP